MTVQAFLKGLFMAIVTAGITIFSQQPVDIGLLIVTLIATILAFVGHNLGGVILNNTSDSDSFNWVDALCALLIAISTGITESIGMLIVDHAVQWGLMLKIVAGATLTYINSTFFAVPKHMSRRLFKPLKQAA